MSTRHIEVERKVRIIQSEFIEIPTTLNNLGFVLQATGSLTDTFLELERDGVMRIRHAQDSGSAWCDVLTVKHLVNIRGTKEKQEQEEPLSALALECLIKLATKANGGKPLPTYSKERSTYRSQRGSFKIEVSLDHVAQLGRYSGYYMEVEIIVLTNDMVITARDCITEVIRQLIPDRRAIPVRLTYPAMLVRTIASKQQRTR